MRKLIFSIKVLLFCRYPYWRLHSQINKYKEEFINLIKNTKVIFFSIQHVGSYCFGFFWNTFISLLLLCK